MSFGGCADTTMQGGRDITLFNRADCPISDATVRLFLICCRFGHAAHHVL